MSTRQRTRKNTSLAKEPQRIDAVFLSADDRTEEVARRLWVRLCRQLAGEFQLHPIWLSFDLLDHEAVFLASARLAAEAQLVFFSTCCSQPLPPTVSRWIETWLPEKAGTTAALVALLRTERRQSGFHGAPHRHLRELARSAGLELFACEYDSANRDCPRWWCGPVASEMIAPPGEPRGLRGVKKPETALGSPARPKNSV